MRIRLFYILLWISIFGKAQTVESFSYEELDSTVILKDAELFLPVSRNNTFIGLNAIKIKNFPIWLKDSIWKNYKGIYWVKKTVRFDSTCKNKSLTINISVEGACEVFLNRKLIKKIGRIGYNVESQRELISDYFSISQVFEADKDYEILIRGSENEPAINHENEMMLLDIKVSICQTDNFHLLKGEIEENAIGISSFLFSFYITLFILHFTIFFLNRYEVSNLYYSIILFFAAYISFSRLFSHYSDNYFLISTMEQISMPAAVTLFHFLPFMFRAIFKIANPKWYFVTYLVLFITFYVGFNDMPIANFFSLLVIFFGITESLRIIIIALKHKKEGAKAIALGILALVIIMLLTLILIINKQNTFNVADPVIGMIMLLIVFLALTGVPLSLTFYLAHSISRTNKFLSKKLIQVEELSKQTIEQEKEKQQILAEQNITLDKQVKERTSEIQEQKKIIEEKNKDIIDSINYAKQIQTSILPEGEIIKSIFPNSFIFYSPKDIVSGDFYYITEIKGNKIVVTADCTGHGVPGALMSMVGSNIINKLTHENEIFNPKDLIENLHKELRHSLKQDLPGSINRDGMDLAAITITKDKILYSGANRPLIYFDQKGELNEIKPDKTPVGGSHIEKIELTEHQLAIKDVKQLFLFSDGFADQFGGPDNEHGGKKIMVSRFKKWLVEISTYKSEEQEAFLVKKFTEWKGKNEQVDDVMVIGIKP
ncbi:MAG: SpoIIE family protein phosphatase [Sphingobacteriaceae bacterium]|nr:SpoIIE family protein phosphatase [Sphingobacteriaceae bacterium]